MMFMKGLIFLVPIDDAIADIDAYTCASCVN